MVIARRWHVLTAVVATGAVAFQLLLVVQGAQVLDEQTPPDLGTRLYQFVAYFTIQGNVLVAIVTAQLARDPGRDGRGFRVLRLAAIVGIAVTAVVHFVLLRPLLDLDGADWAADKLLHMVVPALAVVGWVAFGPRPRVDVRVAALALAWPIGWLAWTLVVGGLSGWFPYPFLDHRKDGAGAVVVACLGVTAMFVAVAAVAAYADRRLAPVPPDAPG